MGENGLDLLLAQHQQIRNLFDQVASAGGDAKQQAFDELRRLLAVHETAEELVVRPLTMTRLPGGEEIAQRRIDEENKGKQLLADLENIGVADPKFDQRFSSFRQDVERHAQQEEEQEFPRLRGALDQHALHSMARAIEAAEAAAPTHPHPSAKTITANLVLGPFASIVDRVRDAVGSERK